MTRYSCYWYLDDIPYDWPMTIEIDENEEKILSVTIPIERENGETVDMRFLPESEYDKLKAERDYLWMNANPTAYELRTVRTQWKKDREENDKLRELVWDMFKEIDDAGFDPYVERQGKRGPYYEEDPSWRVGIRERVRELGIEVGE